MDVACDFFKEVEGVMDNKMMSRKPPQPSIDIVE